MIPGAPHKEGTRGRRLTVWKQASRVTNANQKPGDASSALEMVRNDVALKACAHFTRNHLSTQTLAQGNQGLALEERGEVE
jgi:hypothetical protein